MAFDPRQATRPPQSQAPMQGAHSEDTTGRQPEHVPFRPGAVIGKVPADQAGQGHLTEYEQQILRDAGVEGNPGIPLGETEVGKRLDAEIARLRREAENVKGAPVPLDRPPVPPPKVRDFQSLTPDEQAEIRQKIENVQREADITDAMTPPGEVAHIPGMDEAWRTAIVDDVSPQQANDPQPSQAARPPAQKQTAAQGATQQRQPGPQSRPQDGQQPADSATLPSDSSTPLTASPPAVCPHCGCNTLKNPVEISDYDKAAYLGMLLGGRFYKEYTLCGGHITITFRNLTPRDLDTIAKQLAADVSSGKLTTSYDFSIMRTNYETAAALARISRTSHGVDRMLPLGELACGDDKTPLPQLLDWLYDNVITADSVRRIVIQKWYAFSGILDELDAKKEDPDFFSGIAPAPSFSMA